MSAPGIPILSGCLTVEGVALATAVLIAAAANTNGLLIVSADILDATAGGFGPPAGSYLFGASQTMLRVWKGSRATLPAGQYLYLPAGLSVSIVVNAGATIDHSMTYKVL